MNNPVRLVSISRGAEFAIQLSAFAESEPFFAYVDDVGSAVELLHGAEIAGRMTIQNQPPFMWLDGPRDCLLLKPDAQGIQAGRMAFRSLGVGEFCLELYYVRPDLSVKRLIHADFCFK